MPKKSKKKKIKPVPKVKRFSPEQADKFLSVLEATSIPKEQIEFAKAFYWLLVLNIIEALFSKGYRNQWKFN